MPIGNGCKAESLGERQSEAQSYERQEKTQDINSHMMCNLQIKEADIRNLKKQNECLCNEIEKMSNGKVSTNM